MCTVVVSPSRPDDDDDDDDEDEGDHDDEDEDDDHDEEDVPLPWPDFKMAILESPQASHTGHTSTSPPRANSQTAGQGPVPAPPQKRTSGRLEPKMAAQIAPPSDRVLSCKNDTGIFIALSLCCFLNGRKGGRGNVIQPGTSHHHNDCHSEVYRKTLKLIQVEPLWTLLPAELWGCRMATHGLCDAGGGY